MKYMVLIDDSLLPYFRIDADGKEKVLILYDRDNMSRGFPLRPMPEKIQIDVTRTDCFAQYDANYAYGRNDLIDEILGDE